MTVGELRALLADLPDDARVVVDGGNNSYDDPTVKMAATVFDAGGPCSEDGRHDSVTRFTFDRGSFLYSAERAAAVAVCVVISRYDLEEPSLFLQWGTYADALAAVEQAKDAPTG